MTVQAQDAGKPMLSSTVTVYINVIDENDNAPEFQKARYEGSVLENCHAGTPVDLNAPVRTIDRDAGPNSVFSLALKGDGKSSLSHYTSRPINIFNA